MKKSDDTIVWVLFAAVFLLGIFVFGFGIGITYGREEYKNELHKQLKENNRLLKENIALIAKLKEVEK